MATAGSPRVTAGVSATALPAAMLLQSQFQNHRPSNLEEVDKTCMVYWMTNKREKVCTQCSPYLTETEMRSNSAVSISAASPTSSSTSVASSSSSSPVVPAPALAVKQNPMLLSSQLDRDSLPPFITIHSSRAFIIRMMHLWVATAGTWCLEKGWNGAVEYLEGEDWLKLTPTHTTLWVAIAASAYLVGTHICNWQFPNPAEHNPPTRTFLKTLKVLTCAHVAAAITCYFKIWIDPIKGLACLGVTFALPYGKIERWGGLRL